jgi:ankyrin repeat protein
MVLLTDFRTALHEAVSFTHNSAVKWLIHKGADLNIKNSSGETPFDLGKRIGYADAVLEELLGIN